MPMSILYPAERDTLHILYARLDGGDGPSSFGPWESTSLHIAGSTPSASFGVLLRNDFAQPWAVGHLPTRDLSDNATLGREARWHGTLVGLTPSAQAVVGDTTITVNLTTQSGNVEFSDLEAWSPRTAPSAAGTGTTWGSGDLSYTIAVSGNTFRESGGDDGLLTGIFTGQGHEGAVGTLERSDLTAAFGASH